MRIKGETVILVVKEQVDTDPMGAPIYGEPEYVPVENVCVGNPAADPLIETNDLNGRRTAFVLGIPKGDTHNWTDVEVIIRGDRYRTYGPPLIQTEANIPARIPWNTQIKVERYE